MPGNNCCWRFVCTKETESECFNRMLFGDKIEYCKNVRKNDLLVLYNTETDTLYGPFIAISDIGKNIDPHAWRGRFPYQVKIGFYGRLYMLPHASKYIDKKVLRKQRLEKTECLHIIDILQKHGSEVHLVPISVYEELLRRIREADEKVHRKAHRIEEISMKSMHPADKIIMLERAKSEFCDEMRKFVWAIREFDRKTGLLNLPSNKKDLLKH